MPLRTILTKPLHVRTLVGTTLTTTFLGEGAELQITPGLAQVWEQMGEVLKERGKALVDAVGEEQSRNKDPYAEPTSEYFWRVRDVEMLAGSKEVRIHWETQLNRTWESMYLKVPYEEFFAQP